MSKRSLAVILCLMPLAGCGALPRPNAVPPPIRIVSVSRVVVAPCVTLAQIPAVPARAGGALNGSAHHDADVLAAALLAARGWMDEAAALLAGCAEGAQGGADDTMVGGPATTLRVVPSASKTQD